VRTGTLDGTSCQQMLCSSGHHVLEHLINKTGLSEEESDDKRFSVVIAEFLVGGGDGHYTRERRICSRAGFVSTIVLCSL